jgi:cadmium resistance protein CadD (predicted permease)
VIEVMTTITHALNTAILGGGLFASTNIDDIFLLMAFFADPRLRGKAVVFGQFIGIASLIGLSLLGAAGALFFSHRVVALLGLVPLILGIRSLVSREGASSVEDEEFPVDVPGTYYAQVLSVAGVTFANGGDNLAVYIPVFADDFSLIPIFIVVFALMTALWCVLARYFVTHPRLVGPMRKLSPRLLPYVLIVLGVWILSGVLGGAA